ncbi:MAG: hypothetical protein Q8P22_09835 [Chloroflexota bacterium]|nr:hypothetical protein [Chloroflexota bacterium]
MVVDLSRQLADSEHDKAELARRVDALTEERDYLHQAHAAALTLSQRLLPERATAAARWQFWRH